MNSLEPGSHILAKKTAHTFLTQTLGKQFLNNFALDVFQWFYENAALLILSNYSKSKFNSRNHSRLIFNKCIFTQFSQIRLEITISSGSNEWDLLNQCKFQALFCGRYTARILNFELSFETQYLGNFHFVSKYLKKMGVASEIKIFSLW